MKRYNIKNWGGWAVPFPAKKNGPWVKAEEALKEVADEKAKLKAFQDALEEELKHVTTLLYNSHDICEEFLKRARIRAGLVLP